ncbi:hypothetical protein D9M71_133300 [compost metagenome]
MTTALHQQAEQQQEGQQGGAADGDGGVHLAVHQLAGREDAGGQAGFLELAALDQPVVLVEGERRWRLRRIGLVGDDGSAFGVVQGPGGAEAPVAARGDDHHAIGVGHHQLFRGFAPKRLGVVQVHLHHQDADDPSRVPHGTCEEVTALARGGAQAEEAPLLAGQGFAEVRAEDEVAADETVGLVPVRRGQGEAGGAHQVDHVGPGVLTDLCQYAVGLGLQGRTVG